MPKLSRSEQKVYDLLVQKAQAKGKGFAKLAYATIATYTRLDETLVRECIKELAALGLITIERVPNSSNRYWIAEMGEPEPQPEPVVRSVFVPPPKRYLYA